MYIAEPYKGIQISWDLVKNLRGGISSSKKFARNMSAGLMVAIQIPFVGTYFGAIMRCTWAWVRPRVLIIDGWRESK